jgi:hypothetical protein
MLHLLRQSLMLEKDDCMSIIFLDRKMAENIPLLSVDKALASGKILELYSVGIQFDPRSSYEL